MILTYKAVTPCFIVVASRVKNVLVIVCVVLTVLGEVKVALRVFTADQLGTLVKVSVSHFEIRDAILRW
jgi:hypothetical protein